MDFIGVWGLALVGFLTERKFYFYGYEFWIGGIRFTGLQGCCGLKDKVFWWILLTKFIETLGFAGSFRFAEEALWVNVLFILIGLSGIFYLGLAYLITVRFTGV